MKFEYSDEQAELRNVVREMLADAELPAGVYDHSLWSSFVTDMQLLSIHVPEEEGGAGGSLHEMSILFSEFGRAAAALPAWESAVATEAIRLADFGVMADVAWEELLTGGTRMGFSAHGFIPSAAEAAAGEKVRVTGSIDMCVGEAPELIVVRTGRDRVVVIDAANPGVTVTPTEALDPHRATCIVTLEDTEVAVGAFEDEQIERFDAFVRLLLASELEGIAAACLDHAVDYAKQREQYGRPIGSFQAIKHHCADMAIALDGLQPAVMYAALALEEGYQDAALATRIAFSTALETAETCASTNLQVHGGIGFTEEASPHLYLKRVVFDSAVLTSQTDELLEIADAIGIGA